MSNQTRARIKVYNPPDRSFTISWPVFATIAILSFVFLFAVLTKGSDNQVKQPVDPGISNVNQDLKKIRKSGVALPDKLVFPDCSEYGVNGETLGTPLTALDQCIESKNHGND